jgi:hypothetical protein
MSCSSAALKMSEEFDLDEVAVEEQIQDFLDGRTHGEDLFHALYDHVLDEPVPARLSALLRD